MTPSFEIRGQRFLVTGGTGFIGSALVRGLVNAGGIVRTLDNDSRGTRRKFSSIQQHIEIITGDIRDPVVVRKAVAGVDYVCHLAYINGTEYFYTKPDLVLEVAVKGMTNVLDACLAEGVKNIILASSSEVYQLPPVVPTDERIPLIVPDIMNPRYSYGGGKIISELLLVNYGRKYFNRALIFRPHNVYGPDMGYEHVIPQFATRMKQLAADSSGTIEFPIQGTGNETRSFIYIDDFVSALIKVIQQGKHLDIYHIGTENEVSIRELALMIAACFNREIKIVPGPVLEGSTPRRCPDVTKLSKLGFKPNFDLARGLKTTVAWYQNLGPISKEDKS
jgi:nucleoside-diphosphate-sugar epimerase